jgi:DNA-binding HxlR family transcriptional regulator
MDVKSLDHESNFADIENCPVRLVVDRIGEKWSMLILLLLKQNEVMRYSELHRNIRDISQKMLSQTLKSLEADGLICRKVYPVVPPKVEYRLTQMGEELHPLIHDLTTWANKNLKNILENRKKYAS